MEMSQPGTSVFVKHHLLPFTTSKIKNIDIQKNHNLLLLSSGSRELFLASLNEKQETEISIDFLDKDLKNATVLRWSPDGRYLALACDNLVLFEVVDSKLKKACEFADHSLEIISLSWAPDSKKVVTTSLDAQIFIRNLDQNTQHSVQSECKVLSLTWDPLDKYIGALTSTNHVVIYNSATLEVFKKISLQISDISMQQQLREDRKIDWSPDCQFLLVPSLDDKLLPVLCALERQDFSIVYTFTGPFSSINCVRFSPVLYRYDNMVINVFALGDNDGNISVWRLANGMNDKDLKAMKLFKSHQDGREMIEDLAWSQDGSILMATTYKQYLFMAKFQNQVFGAALNPQEFVDYKENNYGLFQQRKKFAVYQNQLFKNEIQPQIQIQPQVQQKLVITQQQVEVKGGKKFIIPQMQKVVDTSLQPDNNQMEIEKPIEMQQQQPKAILKSEKQQPIYPLKELALLPLQYTYRVNELYHLECEYLKDQHKTKIRQIVYKQNKKLLLWNDIVEGRLQLIMHNEQYFVYYTNAQLLYISTANGRRYENPFVIDNLLFCYLNKNSNLLVLDKRLQLKVYNIGEQQCVLKEDIGFIYGQNLKECGQEETQIERVHLDQQDVPFVFFRNKTIYFYLKNGQTWSKMSHFDYELDMFSNFNDKEIYNRIEQKTKQKDLGFFFENLRSQGPLQSMSKYAQVADLEEKMIFYLKQRNVFMQVVKRYVQELLCLQEWNKVRQLFQDIFINSSCPEFRIIQEKQKASFYKELILLVQKHRNTEELANEICQMYELVFE